MDVTAITLRTLVEHPLDIPLLQWALFALVMVLVGVMIYLQTRNDPLDLRWLILDANRKPALGKIGQVVALIISTWAFALFTIKGTLTEFYFISYMVAWSGSAALEQYLNRGSREARRKDDPPDYVPPTGGGNPWDRDADKDPK
jgi:uncharacterized iron-regulated membrane protein